MRLTPLGVLLLFVLGGCTSGVSAPVEQCGNDVCDPDENCVVCPNDCPPCVPPVDGGQDAALDDDLTGTDTGAGDGDGSTADLGPCSSMTCASGEHCAVGPKGPFCTTCDPQACAAWGAICCPDHAADGKCTAAQLDADNCGACNVTCAANELCNAGVCEKVGTLATCAFNPMQWWSSPTAHDKRDVTFVVLGDTHAEDPTSGCSRNPNGAPDQNLLARQALNSVVPGPSWTSHLWPAGASFTNEGKPYDHVRGVIIAGDLTQAGDRSIPAGQQTCREYKSYRDAYGLCGDEGRLGFPVYDGYGNHDFPRNPGSGDVTVHPVIDRLDAITAAYRPGVAADLFDDPSGGTAHFAWRWDDIWFVNMDVKPGWKLETIAGSGNTRIVDPHHSRGFLKQFLLAQPTSSKRQIVIVSHYPINSDRIDDEEQTSFCKLIYNAQHASGDFPQQKLSLTNPVVAFLHGHDHKVPAQVDWTCPSPYASVTLPLFRVGTPLYKASQNQNGINFSVLRLGDNVVEVVGVRAPAGDPSGPWSTVYTKRLARLTPP